MVNKNQIKLKHLYWLGSTSDIIAHKINEILSNALEEKNYDIIKVFPQSMNLYKYESNMDKHIIWLPVEYKKLLHIPEEFINRTKPSSCIFISFKNENEMMISKILLSNIEII